MAKVVKTVRIEESLIDAVNKIADQEFNGNATAALEACIGQAVALRKIPENVRWGIYSNSNQQMLDDLDVERGTKDEYEAIRSLTTALWI